MFSTPTKRNTWLDVDLAQLARNFQIIQKEAGVPVLVVVKANAYGHGLVQCARTLAANGAQMFGVATVCEAMALRDAGITTDILRITAYGPDEVSDMVASDIQFFCWEEEHLRLANEAAGQLEKVARLHLQIDTGMGREGLFADQALDFAKRARSYEHIELVGITSHFYLADSDDTSSVSHQYENFMKALSALEREGLRPPIAHLANSPGLLRFPHARFDMVRSGVITYGMPYEEGFPLPEGIRPIATWKARIVSVKTLPPGHVVSYGGQYVTSGFETIAILPVGYADGLHRFPKNVNHVLFQGRRIATVGRICMDQAMIRIPEDLRASVGDEVVIIGKQGNTEIDSLDVASRWGTNNYDVLCNISMRVPRVFSEQ
jgi:alanine racemase